MAKSIILISSRLAATRLPNKPLLKINNKTIKSHVYDKAIESKIGDVWVATCDKAISDEIKNILNQRFFQNMTMVEIAKANGYSRETARRRLKTAIKKCKKINMIEN